MFHGDKSGYSNIYGMPSPDSTLVFEKIFMLTETGVKVRKHSPLKYLRNLKNFILVMSSSLNVCCLPLEVVDGAVHRFFTKQIA